MTMPKGSWKNTPMTESLRTSTLVPAKASLDGLEDRWGKVWDEEGTYSFGTETTREQVY